MAEYVVGRNGSTLPPPALMGTASCKCIKELKSLRNWDYRLIRSRNKTAPEEPLGAAVLCGGSLGVMLASREKSGQASDPTFVPSHWIGYVQQHSKKGAKDTYTCRPARAILYMCIPQKAVIVKSIPKNSKSFRQKMRSVRPTKMIYGDRGCKNLPATIIII